MRCEGVVSSAAVLMVCKQPLSKPHQAAFMHTEGASHLHRSDSTATAHLCILLHDTIQPMQHLLHLTQPVGLHVQQQLCMARQGSGSEE